VSRGSVPAMNHSLIDFDPGLASRPVNGSMAAFTSPFG
jgi:hypothetical protein